MKPTALAGTLGRLMAVLLKNRLRDGDLVVLPEFTESEGAFAYLLWFREGKRVEILPDRVMPTTRDIREPGNVWTAWEFR